MKTVIVAAASLMALALAPQAAAQDVPKPIALSGSATLTSDYRFRGVSQSDKRMAVQAGVTAKHESGLYAGVWASSLAGWGTFGGADLPRDFQPALIRAAAVVVMPFGAMFAMGSGMPDPIAKIVSA